METEIKNCLNVLKRGGIILYPTDTIWGIGCDATNPKAIEKVYRLKKRADIKSLIILLASANDLATYLTKIPAIANDLMKNVEKPLTIIYPNARNLPKNVVAEDNSIAIRIVRNEFCIKLIKAFGKPIVSTSANISGDTDPLVFKQISSEVLSGVDYVVNLYQDVIQEMKPSRIIKLFENGEFNVIRA